MAELLDHPISGAYWAKRGQLLAGPYPAVRNEARTRDRFKRLLDAGVTFFLDLTHARELAPYDQYLPPGVTHRRLSITDMTVPSEEDMITILDTIDAAIAEGQTVYMHCWAGLGRTGTVVGCWLVRHGMPGAAALARINELRDGLRDSPQTEEQRRMVRHWREGQ